MNFTVKQNCEFQLTVLKNDKGELFRIDKNGKPYFLVDLDLIGDRITGQVKTIIRTIHSTIHPKFYQKLAQLVKTSADVKAEGVNFTTVNPIDLGYRLPRHNNPLGNHYDIKLPFKYKFTTSDGQVLEASYVSFFVFDGESPEKELDRIIKVAEKTKVDVVVVDDIDEAERTAEIAMNNATPPAPPASTF